MNHQMNNLKDKIKNTNLFSDKEKIELLTGLNDLSDEAKSQLEKVIDDYDESLASLNKQFKGELHEELDKIDQESGDDPKVKEAIDQYKTGLDKLIPE